MIKAKKNKKLNNKKGPENPDLLMIIFAYVNMSI